MPACDALARSGVRAVAVDLRLVLPALEQPARQPRLEHQAEAEHQRCHDGDADEVASVLAELKALGSEAGRAGMARRKRRMPPR